MVINIAKRRKRQAEIGLATNSNGDEKRQIDFYDSSDEEGPRNTIGNIPLSWYGDCVHIGYDKDGNQIMKKPKKDELDLFLEKIEDPDYWKKVFDRDVGDYVTLSDEQVERLSAIGSFRYAPGYNPYEPFYDIYSSQPEIHPISNRPEPKRSFLPSRDEALIVGKMVHSIKMGWMKPRTKETEKQVVDIWAEENSPILTKREKARMRMHFAAPKVDLPGNAESYNPPAEYLFDEDEQAKYEETEPEDRRLNFIPQKYTSYRAVPSYEKFYNERYERCVDLYLAPRRRKMKLNVDPSQLLPDLPDPEDLRPYPTTLAFYLRGHSGEVRSLSFEPSCGELLASGGQDGTLRLWSISSGRCVKTFHAGGAITSVAYIPNTDRTLIAATVETSSVLLLNVGHGNKSLVRRTQEYIESLNVDQSAAESLLKWSREPENAGQINITLPYVAKQIVWHGNGNYFATFALQNSSNAIHIHQLSTCRSQVPFSRMKGTVTGVLFHPTLPHLFLATQRNVRIYDLKKCQLIKKVFTGSRWVSCLQTDTYGSNLFIGGLDRVFSWVDLDLSSKPWKSFRHHKGAVRSIAYHRKYPLLATASDDASVIVYHAQISVDFSKENQVLPVKKLSSHSTKNGLSVLCTIFHPTQPWLVTAGADGLITLFSY